MKKIIAILIAAAVAAGCTSVRPSPIQQACYNVDYQYLTIEFSDGSRYRYLDVPAAVFEGLHIAESRGAYFNLQIRNQYAARNLNLSTGR
jgi:hypothetical protein